MEGAGELRWDIEPVNGKSCFFTHATYEKYSLGPTLAELLVFNKTQNTSESASENREKGPSPLPVVPEKNEVVPLSAERPVLPEPRVPYPRCSSLSAMEQKAYVQLMIKYKGKKGFKPAVIQLKEYEHYQFLKSKCSFENVDFQKYLQNSARRCVEDYNWISADAELYVQEVLKSCQTYVKKYPKFYSLHEVTSILGGKVTPDLTLKLEKCLLVMGSANFMKMTFPTTELELQTTFNKVASSVPPASKASAMHTSVSSDPNAAKLATKYGPQAVMTSQVLYTLLNNHGPSYKEQWEIPFRVETITSAEGKTSKIVYMDSPLPKKEMSIREKSQIFHEVPLELFTLKKSGVLLQLMQLDKTDSGHYTFAEDRRSGLQETRENLEMDFENDVTELETFGTTKFPPKVSKPLESEAAPKPISVSLEQSLMTKLMMEKQIIRGTSTGVVGEKDKVMPSSKAKTANQSLWSDSDDTSSFKGFESDELKDSKNHEISSEGSGSEENMEGIDSVSKPGIVKQPLTEPPITNDSDDDQLVIDIGSNNMVTSSSGKHDVPSPSLPKVQETRMLPKRPAKRLSKQFDPVGQILKMQTKLLKPEAKKMQEPSTVNQDQLPAMMSPVTPASEPVEDSPKNTVYPPSDLKKSLLPINLLASKEDEAEYTSLPDENCAYKLFSLADTLLLIRSGVHRVLTRVRAHKKSTRMQLPAYILTKMDYQTCYGAEMLTESETCRLWTESLLHSNSSLYIGHIDALTSKFFMLEEISQEELKDRFSNFNPVNSLVTLRHILKLVTGLRVRDPVLIGFTLAAIFHQRVPIKLVLKINAHGVSGGLTCRTALPLTAVSLLMFQQILDDGSYLLSHAAGDSSVSIYRSISNRARGAYNLHQAHSSLPKAPSSLSVPWVPVDPNILLPIHRHHCWPPCTFPPQQDGHAGHVKEFRKPEPGPSASQPAANPAAKTRKKKNKGKRQNRLLRWKAKCAEWKAKSVQQKSKKT